MEVIHTIGRRKSAVARVFICLKEKVKLPSTTKSLDAYFPTATHQYKINQPFTLTDTLGKYNLNVTVTGGGQLVRLRRFVLVFHVPCVPLMKSIALH